MRNLVLLFTLSLLPLLGGAQTVLSASEETESAEDKLKVVVIPFHPVRYYFSDCDKNISERSNVAIEDVRKSFRAGMDYAIEHKSERDYEPVNLYQLRDSTSISLMDRFYENVNYSYQSPTREVTAKQKRVLDKIRNKFSEASAKRKGSQVNEEECYTQIEAEEDRYMECQFKDAEFFDELAATYDGDLYVTINQFEIKTDYDKCIDRELGKYRRRIKVHYNVFDSEGNRLYGDVITAKYDSVNDDINQIIMDNFGFLGEYIANSLPKK